MEITMEKARILAEYLQKEEAKHLMDMTAREAAEALAREGFDFTPEELAAFGRMAGGGEEEMGEEDLDTVAGGRLILLRPAAPLLPWLPRLPTIPLPMPVPLFPLFPLLR